MAGKRFDQETIVPPGLVMVYAPTSPRQIRILMDIIRAAGWWVGGIVLKKAHQPVEGVLTRDNVIRDRIA